MSLLPYDIFADVAIGFTAIPLQVKDVCYEAIAGIDRQVLIGERVVNAAVLVGSRALEPIFGEPVSNDEIGIWPEDGSDELFFVDDQTVPGYTDVDTRKQSFLWYGGAEYRITAVSAYMLQAGRNVYRASRHVGQDQPQ